MLPKIKRNIKRYKFVILIFLTLFGFTSLAIKNTNKVISTQVLTTLQKNQEAKTWDAIKIFHAVTKNSVKEQLEHPIDSLEELASDEGLLNALDRIDTNTISSILYRQLKVTKHFDAFMILDENGIGLANATDVPNKESLLGIDYSSNDFFHIPKEYKKSYISKVRKTKETNNYVLSISTPIFDKENNVKYVIAASIRMKNITERITIPAQTNNYTFVLTDSKGTLIYDGVDIKTDPPYLESNDRIISRLVHGETDIYEQELNYKNEKVLAYGTRLDILNETFLLVTYFPTYKFELENQMLLTDIKVSQLKIMYLDYALAVIAFLLLMGLVVEHVKNETKNRT